MHATCYILLPFGRQGKPARPLVVQRRWGWIMWDPPLVRIITLGTLGCDGGSCFDWDECRNSDQNYSTIVIVKLNLFVCH